MTNGDPEGWIFLSYTHTNNDFFFLLTTVFIYLFILFIYLFIFICLFILNKLPEFPELRLDAISHDDVT